jgi:hypothetical protein
MLALIKSFPAGTVLVPVEGCQVNLYNPDGTPYSGGNLPAPSGDALCDGAVMKGVCVDSNYNIYSYDTTNSRLLKWNADGNFDSVVVHLSSPAEEARDCSVDSEGNIYLAANDVVKTDSTGNILIRYYTPNNIESVELNPAETRLYYTDKSMNVYYIDLEHGGKIVLFYTQVAPNAVDGYNARQIKVGTNGDVVVEFTNPTSVDFVVRYRRADRHEWKGKMVVYANRFPEDYQCRGLALNVDNESLFVQSQGYGNLYNDVYNLSYESNGLYFGWNVNHNTKSYGLEVIPRGDSDETDERSEHRHEHNSFNFEDEHSSH